MLPTARRRPLWITATRSQSLSTSLMMWVEKMMHLPTSRQRSMNCNIVLAMRISSPSVGSSKITTGGSWTIDRAIATFCFMPVDSFSQRMSANSSMSKSARSSSTRAFSRSPASPWSRPKYSSVSRAVSRP